MNKKYILDKDNIEKKLRRMALEIVEQNYDEPSLILLGIKENGLVIAEKLSAFIKEAYQGSISVVSLSLDKRKPSAVEIGVNIDFNNQTVILVDDVANSGKTMLYALQPLLKTHPKKIQTVALVERTHKSFPIELDYIGLSVSTTLDEHIFVGVENNQLLGAWIEE